MARITGKVVAAQRGSAEPIVVDNAHALRLHERPIDSHDSFSLEPLQRFRKRQETCAGLLMKADFAKIRPALRRAHRHHAIVFEERLKMSIRLRLLPQRVNFGSPAFLHDDGEARGFDFEELHEKKSPPENYGKEDQTTVAAFLLWRGS